MPLHRNQVSKALKKLHRRAPSVNVCEKPKFQSPPLSPTSILTFEGDHSDSDLIDGSSQSSTSLPPDVRKGFFAVYVGDEAKRYVVPLNYLKHRVFVELLRRAEEEFGFDHSGAIRLPCETVLFEHLLWLLNRDDPCVQSLEMEELLKFYQGIE